MRIAVLPGWGCAEDWDGRIIPPHPQIQTRGRSAGTPVVASQRSAPSDSAAIEPTIETRCV